MKKLFYDTSSASKKKILSRIFLSYGILILLLLIIGIFFYDKAVKNTELQITQENTFTLEQKISELDSSFYIFNSFASQLSTNTNTHQLMLETELTPSYYMKAYNTMNYLTELMYMQSALPITNCFIYLPKTDRIILPTTSLSSNIYYNFYKKYNSDFYDDFMTMITTPKNANCFLSLEPYLDDASDKDSYLYFCNLYLGTALSTPDAFFCFTIDESKILSNFSEADIDEDHCLYIYNPKQDLEYIFPTSNSLSYSPKELIDSKTSFLGLYEADNYIITKAISDTNDWEYYYIQPNSEILSGFYTYKHIYQLVLLFASIVSISGFFALTRRGIRPYIEMQNQLQHSEAENTTLHHELEGQLPVIKNAYLYRVANGYFDQSVTTEKVSEFLNLDFENNKYAVLYLIALTSYDQISEALYHTEHPRSNSEDLEHDSSSFVEEIINKHL